MVYSPATAALREAFADRADFALQHEPRGTGDALRAAVEALPEEVTEIVVLSGDVPLIEAWIGQRAARGAPRRTACQWLSRRSSSTTRPATAGSMIGRAARSSSIVEEKDATADQRRVSLTNAGLYAFDVAWLRSAMPRLTPSPTTGEIYLTQLVELAAADGKPAVAVDEPDQADWQMRARRHQ